jgi:ribosome assembly protein 1
VVFHADCSCFKHAFCSSGKTTLADALVASNGIISQKLAGKMRYMDSRKDEQERGITMKSSCISLAHQSSDTVSLINLIDSPGHVDFCGEVSAAVRLCDGCLIIVDVVEGVCPQTISALRQAWMEHLKPILILNKIDRLILEQKLAPLDAYVRMQQLIEQINVIVGELFTSDVFQEYSVQEEGKRSETRERTVSGSLPDSFTFDWSNPLDEEDDSDLYFNPVSGNVIFASAFDCWAFSIPSFSSVLSSKLGISEVALSKTLWGDFYIDNKKKRIFRGCQSLAKKPLFVQLVIENIWNAYDAISVRKDAEKINKIIQSLGIQVPARELSHSDARTLLKSIFSKWLPLSDVVLHSVTHLVPSPLALEDVRIENFMCSKVKKFDHLPPETRSLKSAFKSCSADDAACKIVCVSKMFSVSRKSLPEHKPRQLTLQEIEARRAAYKLNQEKDNVASNETKASDETVAFVESDEIVIGFARVFSGRIKSGDKLYVLGPKYDPSKVPSEVDTTKTLKDLESDQHVTQVTLTRLFILMGRDLEEVSEAFAGNVVGIAGLEHHVLKSATLSDSLHCTPFVDLHVSAEPILKVAVETRNPSEMPLLLQGLKYLNQSDPNVIIRLEETGEHVIITPGEVHLQKCIDDLENTFAKVALNVSSPIVPFRETIIPPPTTDMVNEAIASKTRSSSDAGSAQILTPNKKFRIKMKALPLPDAVSDFIEEQSNLLHAFHAASRGHEIREQVDKFKQKLSSLLHNVSDVDVDDIVSFGPKYREPNLLVDKTEEKVFRSYWNAPDVTRDDQQSLLQMYENSFVNGFQMACSSGPLCEEPLMGVAFVVQEWETLPVEQESDNYGPLSGQVMSCVRELCRRTMNAQPRRLKMAMYSCNIQLPTEALGK